MAPIDVQDIIFIVALQEEYQEHFGLTWEGQQYNFIPLPQRLKHSPTLAHHALAQELSLLPPAAGVKV